MTQIGGLSLSVRVASLVEGLMKDVEAEVYWSWVPIPFIKLFWRRLRRMKARFVSMLARFHAGRLAAGPMPTPGSARRDIAPDRPDAAAQPAAGSDGSHPPDGPPPLALPRYSGWVIDTIAGTIVRRFELEEILEDPETAAKVAEAPQLGRLLRPLCRMLRAEVPDWLRLPRRPRAPRKPRRKTGHWEVVRVGAGQLWRGPTMTWPKLEDALKFDAKIRVWVEE